MTPHSPPTTLESIDVSNKNILVRLDLDVPIRDGVVCDDTRLQQTLPTVRYLLERGARVTVIGHLGRPGGVPKPQLSLEPVRSWYSRNVPGLIVAENLRFEPGEEANDTRFAEDIVRRCQAQLYVFDAFASYRPHASVVAIPHLLPTVVGFQFEAEILHLKSVLKHPRRPLAVVLGGAKSDTKLAMVRKLIRFADRVLVGGLLPHELGSYCVPDGGCVVAAKLTDNGLDISEESAKQFTEIIRKAGTVVWNGPMGAFEKPINRLTDKPINEKQIRGTSAWGTYEVAKAVSETKAYTVVGGGDTEAALSKLGLESGIDWISSGGGAMLYYLAYRTLPFLEALK